MTGSAELPGAALPDAALPGAALPGAALPGAALSRRWLLAIAGPAVLTAPVVLAGLAGCTATTGETAAPDPLEPLVARARADAALAEAVAAAHPDFSGRMTPVAEARRAHAQALAQEVLRARPDRAPALSRASTAPVVSSPSGSPSPPAGVASGVTSGVASSASTSAAPPDARAALAAVVQALRQGGRQAADATRTVPRYRAGLVGSVAACCVGQVAVLA